MDSVFPRRDNRRVAKRIKQGTDPLARYGVPRDYFLLK